MDKHAQRLDIFAGNELIVRVHARGSMANYLGTRAALEAEAVIPKDMEWPQGYASRTWCAGAVRFRLARTRPEGAKGPRKAFLDVDWWDLLMLPAVNEDGRARAVEIAAAELRLAQHRASPLARAAHRRMLEARYGGDKAVSAFFSTIANPSTCFPGSRMNQIAHGART